VEDRIAIRPPWRVAQGIYSIHVALVPLGSETDVTDYRMPPHIKTETLPKVGEIEVYVQ
jgi:hypothetical protein